MKIICRRGIFTGCYFVDFEGKSYALSKYFCMKDEVWAMFLVEWDNSLKLLKFIPCKRQKNE